MTTGMVFEGEKRFDLVVRLAGNKRSKVDDVKQLLIPTANGLQIPLSQLATIKVQEGPNQIQREDAKRRIVVGFNVRGRDVESIVTELHSKVNDRIALPTGYFITYGGAFENLNKARQRLMIAVPASLIMIFLLLYFAFRSFRYGLLIYTAIPLSAIGGILFLALRQMPFSISAGIGFIALFGVAVLNGIVLIAEFKRQRDAGNQNLFEIVIHGGKMRLRPVLMTAMVASLGFLPMAISNGAGAEVQRPLATVVIGGLIVATFLTLFVLPILYTLFEQNVHKRNKMRKHIGIILLAVFAGQQVMAQTITHEAAIDSAIKNNLIIKQNLLQADYKQSLRKAHEGLPALAFTSEVGQVNSSYFDTKFSISQSFAMPAVYTSQKELFDAEWKASTLATQLTEADIYRRVSATFYQLLVMDAKASLLDSTAIVFGALLQRANTRFEKGESNILEKTHWETMLANISMQKTLLQADRQSNARMMQWLMHTELPYYPAEHTLLADVEWQLTDTAVQQHPLQHYYAQQVVVAQKDYAYQKTKLLPTLELGYINQSLRGMGADDKLYNGSHRFHAAQVGLGIPLFASAQKARVKAAQLNVAVAEANAGLQGKMMHNELDMALVQYQQQLNALHQYENTQLPNAKRMEDAALQQYHAGEINFMEWVMLYNQAIQIKSAYYDLIGTINETIIHINYLNRK